MWLVTKQIVFLFRKKNNFKLDTFTVWSIFCFSPLCCFAKSLHNIKHAKQIQVHYHQVSLWTWFKKRKKNPNQIDDLVSWDTSIYVTGCKWKCLKCHLDFIWIIWTSEKSQWSLWNNFGRLWWQKGRSAPLMDIPAISLLNAQNSVSVSVIYGICVLVLRETALFIVCSASTYNNTDTC